MWEGRQLSSGVPQRVMARQTLPIGAGSPSCDSRALSVPSSYPLQAYILNSLRTEPVLFPHLPHQLIYDNQPKTFRLSPFPIMNYFWRRSWIESNILQSLVKDKTQRSLQCLHKHLFTILRFHKHTKHSASRSSYSSEALILFPGNYVITNSTFFSVKYVRYEITYFTVLSISKVFTRPLKPFLFHERISCNAMNT